MSQPCNFTVRKRTAALAYFEAILLIPLVICVGAAFKQRPTWIAVLILLGLMLGALVWFKVFMLKLSGGDLCYRRLFGGMTKLPLNNVKSAQIEIGCFTFRDRFRPTVRLVIIPQESNQARPFDIDIKLFEPADIERLLDVLPLENRNRRLVST
jgi:hypothetical protein